MTLAQPLLLTKTKVCSLHFTAEDYINGDALNSARRVLKPTAIPSVFPWTKERYQRTTAVSQLAASPNQRFDCIDDKVKQSSDKHDPTKGKPLKDTNEDLFMEVDSGCNDTVELHKEVEELCVQLSLAEGSLRKSFFRLENICHDNDLIKFYTGFADYDMLIAFYEKILESDAKVMRQWQGKKNKDDYDEIKHGRFCKLPSIDQIFLTSVRFYLGLLEQDLAVRFKISNHLFLILLVPELT